jgi:hypothetical protein
MAWTWRLEDADGATPAAFPSGLSVPAHASQADAESWLGENWRELREAGVAQVTLLDAGSEVYGPMSLSEE